jgi:hypothetical protein
LFSAPSMVIMPPRPSWPAELTITLFVFVGSKLGVGALPGTRNASSRKLRPLSGSVSIDVRSITPSTVDVPAVASGASATASTVSATPPIAIATSSRYVWPTASVRPRRAADANPVASAVSA